MVGHPKLGNDLNRPAMEEIGARAKLFSLDSWGQQKQRYIEWVLEQCSKPKNPIHDIVTQDAINLLAERLITPLQICHYLTLALIKGATTGTKPVDVEIIEAVLSPDLNTLEPKLARQGYSTTALCEHLNAQDYPHFPSSSINGFAHFNPNGIMANFFHTFPNCFRAWRAIAFTT
jgi:hypothetical protein